MPHDLERFTEAQARVWPAPLDEIRAGRKRTHWMWFVWPQLRGLGRSATSVRYGLAGISEAVAYLSHPVLGARLTEISQAMLAHAGRAADAVLGPVDAMKLRSSATLFEAAGGGALFTSLLDAFYDSRRCTRSLELIAGEG